jgi:hypothetical protein
MPPLFKKGAVAMLKELSSFMKAGTPIEVLVRMFKGFATFTLTFAESCPKA